MLFIALSWQHGKLHGHSIVGQLLLKSFGYWRDPVRCGISLRWVIKAIGSQTLSTYIFPTRRGRRQQITVHSNNTRIMKHKVSRLNREMTFTCIGIAGWRVKTMQEGIFYHGGPGSEAKKITRRPSWLQRILAHWSPHLDQGQTHQSSLF